MEYRAVGTRCAVTLKDLRLGLSQQEILDILKQKGFNVVEVDIIALARSCIGVSKYRRGAQIIHAPEYFDCSGFVRWLYAKRGIWIPRRSIQQSEIGQSIDVSELVQGDLVFTSGAIDYYRHDPAWGVGHVGIYTGEGTVVHAANKKVNIVEEDLFEFIAGGSFRGARRYIPQNRYVVTLETPADRFIEISDDIRWVILQTFR